MSIEVSVGVKNGPFRTGLAQMRGDANKFKTEVGRSIAGAFAFGAVTAYLGNIVQKFGDIQDAADKFGTTATAIQRVGGAAELVGTDIDTVGKALSRVAVDAKRAAEEGGELQKQFSDLGINAEAFVNAGMEDRLVMLSQAYQEASKSGKGTAEMIDLLGQRGIDILPLLKQGPEALRDGLNAVPAAGDAAIAAVDALGDAMTRLQQRSALLLVGAISNFQKMAAMGAFGVNTVLHGEQFARDEYDHATASIDQTYWGQDKDKGGATGDAAITKEAQAEADAKASKMAKAKNELRDARIAAARAEMTDAELLNSLYAERNFLLQKANDTTVEGIAAKTAALAVDAKARDLSQKISEEADRNGTKAYEKEKRAAAEAAEDARIWEELMQETEDSMKPAEAERGFGPVAIQASSLQRIGGGGGFSTVATQADLQRDGNSTLKRIEQLLKKDPRQSLAPTLIG